MIKPKKHKRLLPLPSLLKKADKVFSKHIRNRDNYTCVTCGRPGNEAGHYIQRSHKQLRFHPQNVHCQCTRCNHFLSGNLESYALFLVNEYGVQILSELSSLKGLFKLDRDYLNRVIEAYRER